jgi:hypothetical protein
VQSTLAASIIPRHSVKPPWWAGKHRKKESK